MWTQTNAEVTAVDVRGQSPSQFLRPFVRRASWKAFVHLPEHVAPVPCKTRGASEELEVRVPSRVSPLFGYLGPEEAIVVLGWNARGRGESLRPQVPCPNLPKRFRVSAFLPITAHRGQLNLTLALPAGLANSPRGRYVRLNLNIKTFSGFSQCWHTCARNRLDLRRTLHFTDKHKSFHRFSHTWRVLARYTETSPSNYLLAEAILTPPGLC